MCLADAVAGRTVRCLRKMHSCVKYDMLAWCKTVYAPPLQHLALQVSYELCWSDVSPGVVRSSFGNLKSRKWAISSGYANFLTANCVQKLPENVAIISETKQNETNSKAVRGLILHPANSLTHIWIQKSYETPQVIPSTTKYITATGKQALILLQSAAALIPVPMIQEAIGVALKIIGLCEVR